VDDEQHRARSCTGKTPYLEWSDALQAVQEIWDRERDALHPYPCRQFCGLFHIGHPMTGRERKIWGRRLEKARRKKLWKPVVKEFG
jgi:hypothetical protein